MVHAAADLPRVRLHDRRVQPEPIEDAFVCLVHDPVRLPHAVLVAVDRVRVLHQELAYAEQPEPGTELVAVLPFDLVDVLRQVAIGREVGGRHQGDDLLLRGAEDEVALVAIRQLEERVPVEVVAAGRPATDRPEGRSASAARSNPPRPSPHGRWPRSSASSAGRAGGSCTPRPSPAARTRPAARDDGSRSRLPRDPHAASARTIWTGAWVPQDSGSGQCARRAPSLTPPLLSRHNRRLMRMHGMTWTWRRGSRSLMPARP